MNNHDKLTHKKMQRAMELKQFLIPALKEELQCIGDNLPKGTYRLKSAPGEKLVIGPANYKGAKTSWKDVVLELQKEYDIPNSDIQRVARRHTAKIPSTPEHSIRIKNDQAKKKARAL